MLSRGALIGLVFACSPAVEPAPPLDRDPATPMPMHDWLVDDAAAEEVATPAIKRPIDPVDPLDPPVDPKVETFEVTVLSINLRNAWIERDTHQARTEMVAALINDRQP